MQSASCYTLETLYFDTPLFKSIPVTYVITMQASDRRCNYMHQLHKFKPTGKVVVVHNKGRRQCRKDAWVKTTALDLWHANSVILRHHVSQHNAPALILEDDVQFTDDIYAKHKDIESFIKNEFVDVYSLGSQPYLSYPVCAKHIRILFGGCTHAIIFSINGAKKFHNVRSCFGLHDCDMFMQLNTYMGAVPTAVQKFTHTENSDTWNYGGVLLKYNQLYGEAFFHTHAIMGRFGGIVPCFFYVVATVAIIVRSIRRRQFLCAAL